MGLFSRRASYDRSRLFAAAERARTRRRRRRAIAFYREILATEPGNWDMHSKLAPLLAASGEPFDAWVSFRTAARGFLRDGSFERALSEYRTAARALPLQVDAPVAVAELERKRGRIKEAVEELLAARRRLRGRRHRAQAIYLLRRVREIDPTCLHAQLDLATLLARSHRRTEAEMLLGSLAERARGRGLRRVRAAAWRVRPSPRHAWLWLRSALRVREASVPLATLPQRPLLAPPPQARPARPLPAARPRITARA